MAKGLRVSTKRVQIDKANSTIVVAVGVAAFAVAFSLVSAKSLLAKQSYQNKVIGAREQSRDQLQANIDAVDDLKVKYTEFVNRQENIIKGNSIGNGERDGDNARIILDALPSKYDFPALASSLEKVVKDRNYKITALKGIDDEAIQNGGADAAAAAAASSASAATATAAPTDSTAQTGQTVGTAVEMPFELGTKGGYQGLIDILTAFNHSIRPVYIQQLKFAADTSSSDVEMTISGKSYYQPERTLNITEEVVP